MWKSFGTVRSSKRRAPDMDKPVGSLKLIHWILIYPGLYPVDRAIQLLNNWSQMSKKICEILKKCFVSLTAQKDQNIFVLVILKNKRHYLLDIF